MANNFKNPWGDQMWAEGTDQYTRWLPADAAYFTGEAPGGDANSSGQSGSGSSATTKLRKVTITITNKVVGDYEARSYPDDDIDNNGKIELYKVPVYEILIEGKDDADNAQTYRHKAPRFMPYYNDPKAMDTDYKTKGWVNSGLSSARTITVSKYLPNYAVHNRYSPGRGAIVLKDSFYIHAGPADLNDYGFGSAGCVEIIGNFDTFKSNIQSLSGSAGADSDAAIQDLVNNKKLIVVIQGATAPNIKSLFTREE